MTISRPQPNQPTLTYFIHIHDNNWLGLNDFRGDKSNQFRDFRHKGGQSSWHLSLAPQRSFAEACPLTLQRSFAEVKCKWTQHCTSHFLQLGQQLNAKSVCLSIWCFCFLLLLFCRAHRIPKLFSPPRNTCLWSMSFAGNKVMHRVSVRYVGWHEAARVRSEMLALLLVTRFEGIKTACTMESVGWMLKTPCFLVISEWNVFRLTESEPLKLASKPYPNPDKTEASFPHVAEEDWTGIDRA